MEYQLDNKDPGGHFAIIASCYYDDIIDGLCKGAVKTLVQVGITKERIDIIRVPGALELPLATKIAADSKKYVGIIALGAVVKGDTSHYDVVVNESCHHLSAISVESSLPIANGVLTVYKLSDAEARSQDNNKNKGSEAALAVLQMANLLQKIS